MIRFNEKEHKYTKKSGREYISVTTFIATFKQKVNWDQMAGFCAGKISSTGNDYRKMNKKEILIAWKINTKNALRKGSKYHDKKEMEILYKNQTLKKHIHIKGKGKRTNKLFQGYQDHIDLKELEAGITYPELRLYLDKHKIAGHADLVRVLPNGYVDVEDYKTNAKPLSKKGFNGKKLKAPLDFLDDCDYIHYSLQLNIYGYILEQWGYKVRYLKIRHMRFPEGTKIDKKYLKEGTEQELRKLNVVSVKYRPDIIKLMFDAKDK